ncbi:MAG: class I SAM-dependent methyltransferase [Niameybacter sp.]|uniref:class I SAM-dependent methyltransferase n=1 Tax=Niameybacter sp. TaxID=2033640 RepID=UPI002FC9C0E4
MHEIFNKIFLQNLWGAQETVSGTGSTVASTQTIALALPPLFQKYHISSLLDAACGDFNWMQYLNLGIDSYIGIDMVPELIESVQKRYSNTHRQFLLRNIATDDLPKADLILCRDCLVHHTLEDIHTILTNFVKSSSTYVLMTTFPEHTMNPDIETGYWRPLNFEVAPFNFPRPLALINENTARDKSLALWRLDTILKCLDRQ